MDIDAFASLLDPSFAAVSALPTNGEIACYSDRICSADDTFVRVSPVLQRYGITRVSRLTGLDNVGIPVWAAIRPNSLSLAVNQGKGIGDTDAKISAVMEALERAVAGEPEVDVEWASQAEMRARGLATDTLPGLRAKDAAQLGDEERTAWFVGYDLIGGHAVWVPRDAVMLDRTVDTRFWQSSDGLASGNTPLEATFHGLLERIERDAEVLWSLERTAGRARRCIDPTSIHDIVVDELIGKIRKAGLRLQIFDITSDMGIPCFQSLIGPGDIFERKTIVYAEAANGCGCHPDPVRAIIRAVTEAAQSRLTLVSGARDDISPDTYSRPMPKGLIEDFGHTPVAAEPRNSPPDRDDLATKLFNVIEALRHKSIRSAIAVPLNRLDAPFSVVKVLVPELEDPPGDRQIRFGTRVLNKMTRQT